MRFARLSAPATALFLLAACTADRAGQGSSVPPATAQACADYGLTPGSAEFARCQTGEAQRATSAQRGLTGTLFRDVTMAPIH
jgi:hypothetical protein